MSIVSPKQADRLQRCADAVAAVMLTAMFLAFLVQIFMRYVLNWPIGWSTEVCALAWLWVILWGSSVVLKPSEEISFDIIYESVGAKTRRVFRALSSVALVALYAVALPATIGYVSFMQVERSAYMDIPFNYLFSIYILFAVATILRYALIAWSAIRGTAGAPDASHGPGRD